MPHGRRPHASADVPAQLISFIEEGAAGPRRRPQGPRLPDDRGARRSRSGGGAAPVPAGRGRAAPARGDGIPDLCALANFADHMESAARNAQGQSDATELLNRLLTSGPKYFLKHTRCACRRRGAGPLSGAYPTVGLRGRSGRRDRQARSRHQAVTTSRPTFGATPCSTTGRSGTTALPGPDFGYSKNFDTSATVGPWIVVDEGHRSAGHPDRVPTSTASCARAATRVRWCTALPPWPSTCPRIIDAVAR